MKWLFRQTEAPDQLRSERGAAAIEFALILPLLAVLMFAIFELGIVFYRQQLLAGAVREAARTGIIATEPRPTEADVAVAVSDYLGGVGLDPNLASVTVTGAGGAPGDDLSIQITYPYNSTVLSALTFFGPTIPDTMTQQADLVMQLE